MAAKPNPLVKHPAVVRNHNGYMDDGFDQRALIRDAKATARKVPAFAEVDTLIGIGLSGAIAVPVLAYALDKTFCLVRKPGVSSHDSDHSANRLRGNLGATWAFVDDFVSTGGSRSIVIDAVEAATERKNSGLRRAGAETITPVYVGTYQYASFSSSHRWQPADRVVITPPDDFTLPLRDGV